MKAASYFITSLGLIVFLVFGSLMPPPAIAVTKDDISCATAGGIGGTCFYDPTEQCATTDTIYDKSETSEQSLEAKIGQTFIVGFDASTSKSTIESMFKKYKLGGMYLVGTKDAKAQGFDKGFYDSLEKAKGSSIIVASDEEGGKVQRYSYPDISGGLPSAKEMGGMSDARVKGLGEKVGKQLKANGVNTDLAPVLDIDDNKSIVAKNDRAFSDDHNVVAEKADAFAKGLQSEGIKPIFKHWPGFGGAGSGNSDLEPVVAPSSYTLAKNMSPYRDILKNYPDAGVMLSNIFVPDLGRSKPVSINSKAVKYLRDDLKFNGLITTDDLGALAKYGEQAVGLSAATAGALRAGVDAPLFGVGETGQQQIEKKLDAAIKVAKDTVPNEEVDRALSQVNKFLGNSTEATPTAPEGAGGCCKVTPNETTTNLTGSDRVEKAFNFFRNDMGLTPLQAAAVVGNFMQESGPSLDPTIVNGIGATGIAQWTNPPYSNRLPDLKKFASSKGKSHTDFEIQLLFVKYELEHGYKSSLAKLKTQKDLNTAVYDFEDSYERSGHSGIPQRQTYARKVLTQYGGTLVPESLKLLGPSSAATCANQESGNSGEAFVLGEYAWPIDLSKRKINNGYKFPCKTTCHHDGSPAFDLSTSEAIKGNDKDVVGTAVFAITDGTMTNQHIYDGIAGCYSFQFKGNDGWYYYYTHLRSPVVKDGEKVKKGTKLAEVGERKCTGNGSYPHLHIDRGSPKGSVGGYVNKRDKGMVDILNNLYEKLPE